MGAAVEIHNSAVWSAASHATSDNALGDFLEGSLVEVNDDSVVTLPSYAIVYKSNLKRVTLNAVRSLPDNYAIAYNPLLQEINLPLCTSVTSNYAFRGDTSLTTFYAPLLENMITTNGVFNGDTSLTELNLPALSEAYGTSSSYSTSFTGEPGSITKITIGGTSVTLCITDASVIELHLPNAITINRTPIGTTATGNIVALPNMTVLDAPKLRTIGNGGTNGTTVYNGIFRNCTSLVEVDLPELSTLGGAAFSGCTSLSSVSMDKVTSIGAHAFTGCNHADFIEVDFPMATTLSSYIFRSCSGLRSIKLGSEGNPVTSINSNALTNAPTAADVHIWTVNATEFTTGFGGTVHWERA